MKEEFYKNKVEKLIKQANEKKLIQSYSEFCDTEDAKDTALLKEEAEYYIKQNDNTRKYDIGDIVFVTDYKYKNCTDGRNHIFIIINYGQAIDINYFGFILSSNLKKSTYPYNSELNKNSINNLNKDSIVKCDALIEFSEREILFKIGEVTQEELEKFINTYEQYLNQI